LKREGRKENEKIASEIGKIASEESIILPKIRTTG
jgi:hypothetical protein